MSYTGYYRSPYDKTPSYIHDMQEAAIRTVQTCHVRAERDRILSEVWELVPDYITPTAGRMLNDRILR